MEVPAEAEEAADGVVGGAIGAMADGVAGGTVDGEVAELAPPGFEQPVSAAVRTRERDARSTGIVFIRPGFSSPDLNAQGPDETHE
jgi:hypothetical protein